MQPADGPIRSERRSDHVHREPGWYRDPYFLKRERYWDGELWTDECRLVEPAGPAPTTVGATSTTEGSATVDTAPATAPTRPVAASPPRRVVGTVTEPVTRPDTVPTEGDLGFDLFDTSVVSPPAPARDRLQGVLLVCIIVVAVALLGGGVGVLVAALSHPSSSHSSASPAATPTLPAFSRAGTSARPGPVRQAVSRALHARTAVVKLTTQSSASGTSPAPQEVTGSGGLVLATGGGAVTLTLPSDPSRSEQLIFAGPTIYASLGSTFARLTGGKSWVTATPSQLSSVSLQEAAAAGDVAAVLWNPTTLVQQLDERGIKVVSLGTTTFEGAPVQGYAVTLPDGHTEVNVYLTPAKQLRAVVMPIVVTFNQQSVNEDVELAFSDYGVRLFTPPPPANQVLTYVQYQSAVASLSNQA